VNMLVLVILQPIFELQTSFLPPFLSQYSTMVYDVLCGKVVYTCRKWLQAGCISNDKFSRCIVGPQVTW
jgi:hypothetical protein